MGGIAIYALHPGMILISAACTGNIMLHKAFKVVASSYNFCYHLFQYGILLEICRLHIPSCGKFIIHNKTLVYVYI